VAEGVRYVCTHCGKATEAWSDGNPYYLDARGRKHYAYHPDHKKLDRCIGNDSPQLCLTCGVEFMSDSRSPRTCCPTCNAMNIAATYRLSGKKCPFCKAGVFAADPGFHCIS
jgi:DNA-directed RNA polymerase subunit RPC12/RpoP